MYMCLQKILLIFHNLGEFEYAVASRDVNAIEACARNPTFMYIRIGTYYSYI